MFKTIVLMFLTAAVTAIATLGIAGLYLWQSNPFNIKACMIASFLNDSAPIVEDVGDEQTAAKEVQDKNPLLSADQEIMLEKSGIDPATLPTNISPEMEACFEEKLGSDRINEIKNGDFPGPLEILKAKGCL